jgi:CrcB protein
MEPFLLVGIGGAIGSIFRFELSKLQPARGVPVGTALINVLGSFAFSLVVFAAPGNDLYLLLGTGVLGGFTTFSTFCFESFRMLEDHDYHTMSTNMLINVAGSLAGVFAGYLLVQGLL